MGRMLFLSIKFCFTKKEPIFYIKLLQSSWLTILFIRFKILKSVDYYYIILLVVISLMMLWQVYGVDFIFPKTK